MLAILVKLISGILRYTHIYIYILIFLFISDPVSDLLLWSEGNWPHCARHSAGYDVQQLDDTIQQVWKQKHAEVHPVKTETNKQIEVYLSNAASRKKAQRKNTVLQ